MEPRSWRRLLVEPRRLPRLRERPDAHRFVVATVSVGAFMSQLDASIVTLALPALHTEFRAGLGTVEWVALAYLLVLVSAVAAVGRLADMVGRKLLYTYGFAVFGVGSALCAAAPSLPLLVVFRCVQGFGAAMLQANSVALIAEWAPPERLGRSVGVQGAAQAVGLATGPALGGLLIAAGGWRLVFLVSVPAAAVGLALAWLLVPRSRHRAPRTGFDWPGVALFVPAVAGVLAVLSLGDRAGWGSALVPGGLLGCAALVAAFVARERRAASPLLDLELLRRRRFSSGIAAGLLSYLVMFGVLFIVPFWLELRRGATPVQAGLELTVLPAALAVVAPLAGRVADRRGARLPTVTGMVLAAVGLVLLGTVHPGVAPPLLELALVGAGLGAFTPANNAAIMAAAPPGSTGVAGGLLNMTRGLGTSLGVAVTGVVFSVASGIALGGVTQSGAGDAVARGFRVATLFLAAVAAGAALAASTRGAAADAP